MTDFSDIEEFLNAVAHPYSENDPAKVALAKEYIANSANPEEAKTDMIKFAQGLQKLVVEMNHKGYGETAGYITLDALAEYVLTFFQACDVELNV